MHVAASSLGLQTCATLGALSVTSAFGQARRCGLHKYGRFVHAVRRRPLTPSGDTRGGGQAAPCHAPGRAPPTCRDLRCVLTPAREGVTSRHNVGCCQRGQLAVSQVETQEEGVWGRGVLLPKQNKSENVTGGMCGFKHDRYGPETEARPRAGAFFFFLFCTSFKVQRASYSCLLWGELTDESLVVQPRRHFALARGVYWDKRRTCGMFTSLYRSVRVKV